MTTKLARPRLVTSAAGVLSMLDEQENSLKVHALERLNAPGVVEQFWAEIADSLAAVESLYEDEKFSHRELAALIASKVYYHLEEYDDALRLALGAGKMFDLSVKSQYVDTVVSQCIDTYIQLRTEQYEAQGKAAPSSKEVVIDPRLTAIVERMFDRCVEDGEVRQAVGVALEARRIDRVEVIIRASADVPDMLKYCLTHSQSAITSKRFRTQLMELLVSIYRSLPAASLAKQYPLLCRCLFFLDDTESVASIFSSLLSTALDVKPPRSRGAAVFTQDGARSRSPSKSPKSKTPRGGVEAEVEAVLIAYQIAFDLVSTGDQHFLEKLLAHDLLQLPAAPAPASVPATANDETASSASTANTAGDAVPPVKAPELTPEEAEKVRRLTLLRRVLNTEALTDLKLQFLSKSNHTDLQILEQIKASVDQRNSVTHSGIVMAHAMMQAGTTSDVFLRSNLDWMGKAVNWAKFSATATLGLVHKGHVKDAKKVLSSYLPGSAPAGQGSTFSEAGALYALGLIHAGQSLTQGEGAKACVAYLLEQLRSSQQNETLQHGACLGLGLLCMGTADEEIYEELKQVLYRDSAVAGEAAGFAIGLIMLGSASEKAISELLPYAHETQHEKIIRACALALALIMFKREDEAETLIQQLTLEKDAVLRYGAMFAVGLAYCGTSQNAAVRRLLHVSVSDVSDDVKRAAVMNLGFVLANVPEQVPKVVNLLTESYSPHVRYGAALAVGFSCAGTALPEAVKLLMPMAQDTTDFVRQGALLALGLVLMQATEAMTPDAKTALELFMKVAADKHEDVLTRYGAILSTGIMNAGGRNVVAGFYSKSGSLRQGAAVGFTLFAQLWYWHPLVHCLSLAFQPAAVIGLNSDLQMPADFEVRNTATPGLYSYPKALEKKKIDLKEKVATAVLSTTAKLANKRGLTTKGSAAPSKSVDVVMKDASDKKDSKEKDEDVEMGDAEKKEKEEKEKESEILKNPARVLPQQEKFVVHVPGSRYVPVFPERRSGVLILRDTRPGEAVVVVTTLDEDKKALEDKKKKEEDEKKQKEKEEEKKKKDEEAAKKKVEEKEPEAPESFEFAG